MKSFRGLLVAVSVLSLAVPAFAKLSKYKEWPNTPAGYFMTKAERDRWSKLDSDAEAEKFVAEFFAKRPANFKKEIEERAANADKYMTIGKTAGSKTLRGKVVIVFGVPSALDVRDQAVVTAGKRDNPMLAGVYSNANTHSDDGGDPGGTVNGGMPSGSMVRMFHFNYQGPIARTVDRKQIDVTVEADPVSGKDRMSSRTEYNDLESMFEIVAQASIRK